MTPFLADRKPLSVSDLAAFGHLRRPVWLATPDGGCFRWGNRAAAMLWNVQDEATFRHLPPQPELACGQGQADLLRRGGTLDKRLCLSGRWIDCLLSMVLLEDEGEMLLVEGDAPPSTASRPATAAGAGGRRLLVVENNPVGRRITEAMLASLGHDVVTAGDGAAAVAAVAAQCFDLVLMDMRLPDMAAAEAVGLIRDLPPPHGLVPVFCITAEALDAAEALRRSAAIAGFASKPLDKARLAGIVAIHAAPGWGVAAYDPAILRSLADTLDPASLQRILTKFLTDTARRMELMKAAFGTGDRAEISRQAHSIAGAASQFGLTELSGLCRNLCHQVEMDADMRKLQETFARLCDVIPAAQTYLTFALA